MPSHISHRRRSLRIQGIDYTNPGAYFITIVTAGRAEVFGAISRGEMMLNATGEIARREWQYLPSRFPGLELAAFQLMPNHVHGILILNGSPYDGKRDDANDHALRVMPGSVGAIVREYKSAVALRYNRMNIPEHGPLWQRNYYEHIIRSNTEMERISQYILENPLQWALDRENPQNS